MIMDMNKIEESWELIVEALSDLMLEDALPEMHWMGRTFPDYSPSVELKFIAPDGASGFRVSMKITVDILKDDS